MPQNNFSACRSFTRFSGLSGLPKLAAGLLVVCLLCACVPLGAAQDTPAVSNGKTPNGGVSTTFTAEASKCRLGELSASADWQRSNGALSASLVLANFGVQPCDLQGVPQIEIVDENGRMLPLEKVQSAAGEPARVVLDPATAYTAEARFVWSNWCTRPTEKNLRLEVVLPGYPGKLSVPVQDPNGRTLTDTPRCDDQSVPSTLAIEAFSPGK